MFPDTRCRKDVFNACTVLFLDPLLEHLIQNDKWTQDVGERKCTQKQKSLVGHPKVYTVHTMYTIYTTHTVDTMCTQCSMSTWYALYTVYTEYA